LWARLKKTKKGVSNGHIKPGKKKQKKGYNNGRVRVVQTGKNGCVSKLRPLEEADYHRSG